MGKFGHLASHHRSHAETDIARMLVALVGGAGEAGEVVDFRALVRDAEQVSVLRTGPFLVGEDDAAVSVKHGQRTGHGVQRRLVDFFAAAAALEKGFGFHG